MIGLSKYKIKLYINQKTPVWYVFISGDLINKRIKHNKGGRFIIGKMGWAVNSMAISLWEFESLPSYILISSMVEPNTSDIWIQVQVLDKNIFCQDSSIG